MTALRFSRTGTHGLRTCLGLAGFALATTGLGCATPVGAAELALSSETNPVDTTVALARIAKANGADIVEQ